ncbi:MAG: multiprotein-bridging factor 1 family protein [Candidatus Micrarchaeota archaeon]
MGYKKYEEHEECEICGKKNAIYLIYVEGAQMNSCGECAHGAKIISQLNEQSPNASLVSHRTKTEEEEIVDEYGKIIKKAREKLGLSSKQLALKIAEKANYLEHVEKETCLPSLALARKLEKFLKIKLIEK